MGVYANALKAMLFNSAAMISETILFFPHTLMFTGSQPRPVMAIRVSGIFNNRDLLVGYKLYDKRMKPTVGSAGYAARRISHDERGNQIDIANLDINGDLMLDKDGVARWTKAYDARGRVIEVAYFGLDNQPIRSTEGYARKTRQYAAGSDVVTIVTYDVDDAKLSEVIEDTDVKRRTTAIIGTLRAAARAFSWGGRHRHYRGLCGQPRATLRASHWRYLSQIRQ